MNEILAEHIPAEIDLRFSADWDKAFSGTLNQEINRAQFVERFTNNTTLQLAATAADAPRDASGRLQRQQFIGVVEKELRVLWGELCSRLKQAADTDDAHKSQAAIAFRQAVISLFSQPKHLGVIRRCWAPIRIGRANGTARTLPTSAA